MESHVVGELLITLKVCRKYLPDYTDPIHGEHLRLLEEIVQSLPTTTQIRELPAENTRRHALEGVQRGLYPGYCFL